MVQSLRQYGGKFAAAPIIAVTPRFGPPLSKDTLQVFDELGVTYLRPQIKTNYPWFKFLNKPLALVAAEEHITSEAVAWLDSDLLIVDEPDKLELAESEDFLGFPVECKEMGTSGLGDPYEPLWQEFCRLLDINIADLPWVITAETNEQVRLYFNGGIFVYRRSTRFAETYLNICLQLLDSRLGTNAEGYNVGLKEMSSIGFAVIKMKLRWRSLPYSHDYVMLSATHNQWYKEELLREAKIIHYHDSMWPAFWPTFLECLYKTHLEVAQWLEQLGPISVRSSIQWRIVSKLLKSIRTRSEQAYNRSCLSK
ncbi:hypothetical protein H6F67_06150 [Microcoleus sp. FACHB-1515]|nr:hypothetical protein [Microcoleus sp. FACHB-1515]